MKRYLTDETRRLECSRLQILPCPTAPEMQLVKVYPHITFQKIVGFGGALTEAAGYVYAQMDAGTRADFMRLYFGEGGNRYSLGRLSVQSCDFSLTPRSYLEKPSKNGNVASRTSQVCYEGEQDVASKNKFTQASASWNMERTANGYRNADSTCGKEALDGLAGFSIDDDFAYVIPFALDALAVNPSLEFLASPWSPPAWMKSNRSMKRGGHLRRRQYDTWANMIARYVAEYHELGIPVTRLTVQNEPGAIQKWESCQFSVEQEAAFLRDHLKPALRAAGLADVKVLGWDHNKESALDRTIALLSDDRTARELDGIAFHWYSGDHFEALRLVRDLLGPDRELIFSEGCDAYSAGDPTQELPHAEHYAHEIIGDLEAGANAIFDWNILLDEQGGPNHVGNFCDAPVMYDRPARRLNVRLPYYYLGHFSRFIQPGANRILCTRYTDNLETCAFANPDGSHTLVVLNRWWFTVPFHLTWGTTALNRRITTLDAPPHSIQTIVW